MRNENLKISYSTACGWSEKKHYVERKFAGKSNTHNPINLTLLVFIFMTLIAFSCQNIENEWKKVRNSNSVEDLQDFIKEHPKSQFNELAINAIDSLNYIIACNSKDTLILRKFINSSTNSVYKQNAENIIWEIKWPATKIDIANSVYIMNNQEGHVYGELYFYSGSNGVVMFMGGNGPNKVYIWRDFSEQETYEANKHGLRVGLAYLRTSDSTFKFIRKIELNNSDKELCAEFGIQTEDSGWWIRSLLIPKLRPL